jgi:hypothetical protein
MIKLSIVVIDLLTEVSCFWQMSNMSLTVATVIAVIAVTFSSVSSSSVVATEVEDDRSYWTVTCMKAPSS